MWLCLVCCWSLKYQGVERPTLLSLSGRLRFECGMTFPILCLTPESWMGSRVQSTFDCFPELCFLFPLAQVLVGVAKAIYNNFVFPTCAYTAGFMNNNNYYYSILYQCVSNSGRMHLKIS